MTGATRGIGWAAAEACRGEGARGTVPFQLKREATEQGRRAIYRAVEIRIANEDRCDEELRARDGPLRKLPGALESTAAA